MEGRIRSPLSKVTERSGRVPQWAENLPEGVIGGLNLFCSAAGR